MSTTCRRLRQLRDLLPHHTFLQYTATPQGPLLINLIDVLSPDFAVSLTPGGDYTGGRTFFIDNAPQVRIIPANDIPTTDNPLHEPPESLLEAMRLFFLGVASGRIRDGGRGNRSMMVHPSRRTIGHREYFIWVRNIQNAWAQLLGSPDDPDMPQLREDFRRTYEDLQGTIPDLEPFEDLMARLRIEITRTDVHEVNAAQGRTPQIDWRGAYAHILVGGQALDRGVTLEGLTVTYMPRNVGTRRADTVQQRARFFGYKRPYLGYCRIYLEQAVADAFSRYVRHEEDVRNRITEFAVQGRPLDDLRRAFLLPRGLTATRDSIIDVDYVRARFNEGWFYPRAPHETGHGIESNREVVSRFLDTLELQPDEGHADRTVIQQHQVAQDVPLRDAYEELLLNLRFARLSDAQNLLGVLVIMRQHLDENPDATCTIFQMSSGEVRVRTLRDSGEIPNLFQGAAPVNPPERRGEVYPGDRLIRSDGEITIQVHMLDLRDRTTHQTVYEGVPNIAVCIPSDMAGDVLIQDQGGLEEVQDE